MKRNIIYILFASLCVAFASHASPGSETKVDLVDRPYSGTGSTITEKQGAVIAASFFKTTCWQRKTQGMGWSFPSIAKKD